LTLKSIKIKAIDEKSPYFFPTRSLEIRTSEHRIITPTRASTIYEFNQRAEIPATLPIDNPISFAVKKMNIKRINDFLQLNGSYKNLSKKILTDDDMLKYSSIRGHVIQPTINNQYKKNKKTGKSEKIESGVNYLLRNKSLREKFIRFIIKIQTDAGLETISIPYLKQPLTEYQEMAKKISKELRKQDREPLFVIDLGYPKRGVFQELLNYLINDLETKLFAFPNKSFSSAAVSYDALSQLVEKEVGFFSIDVNRNDIYHDDISKMHCTPFVGTDAYSVRTIQFIPDPDEPKKERTKESIKFFNKENLLIEPSESRMADRDILLKEMGELKNNQIKEILEDYPNQTSDEGYVNTLSAISKTHELKASTNEFETLHKRIKSDESTEYVKEHDFLTKTLDSFKDKKPKT